MRDEYDELVRDHEGRRQRSPRDLSAEWERMQPLSDAVRASQGIRERVEALCAAKHLAVEQLFALDARALVRGRGPEYLLAFAYTARRGGRRVPTAIKLRNLATGERSAVPGSTFLEPLVVGARDALDWFVAEGETDGARLLGLVGDSAAVLVVGAGAKCFRPEWASLIPRGATVHLAHDADAAGDAGAGVAARAIGGRTVRVRPPDGTKDWCDWSGGRHEFVKLVAAARLAARNRVQTFGELLERYAAERSGESGEPIRLGFGSLDAELRGVSAGRVLGVAARTAVGKTWLLASVLHTFALRRDAGALTLSLEMPGPEWAERQLAIHADVAPEQVETWARSGELAVHSREFIESMEHVVVADESTSLAGLPAVLDDARERLAVPLRLVVVDYLGLLGSDGRDAYERASALGKGLKELAKAEDVAVVVAMQLSRAGEDGSVPVTMAMLRDSGVLEESLDFLLGAWRPEKAHGLGPLETEQVRDVIRVAILKNRKGNDGRVVDLRFRERSRRVYEPTGLA